MTVAAAELEQLLKAGIAAYRRKDYEAAIAAFLPLSKSGSSAYRIKASMGLVRIFMAQEKWPGAHRICLALTESQKPAVQAWAQAALAKIEPHLLPLPAESEPVSSESQSAKSGFTPFSSHTPGCSNSSLSIFHYAYLNGEDAERIEKAGEEETEVVDAIASNQPVDLEEKKLLAPVRTTDTTSQHSAFSPNFTWVNAGRLQQGRPLGKIKRAQLWTAQLFSAITFYFVLRALWLGSVNALNGGLVFLDRLLPFWVRSLPASWQDITWPLLAVLLVVALGSPWLWDLWLRFTTPRQSFSLAKLRLYSAEAASLIGRCCKLRRWELPTLWLLDTDVPIIFSYGWLPRNARLVISKGFFSQLEPDEVAALVAYEIGHWKTWQWPLLSIQGLLLQLFHRAYWLLAIYGNQQSAALKIASGICANASYVVFWLLRLPGLWVARARTYYSDRTATELTGNPNGLTRGLSKLGFGLGESTVQQGYTPPLVESLALQLPVASEVMRSTLYGTCALSALFAWDSQNPLRNWMSLSSSHPPLGDRLRLIQAYAKHWRLTPEIPLTSPAKRSQVLSKGDWQRLLTQGSPYIGAVLGLLVGTGLQGIGALGYWRGWPAFDWMYKDLGLFQCCVLLGTGVGTLVRINRFFPTLIFTIKQTQNLATERCNAALLPVDGLPVKLQGMLIGRPGIANWLGQDILLQTQQELIRLHFFSVIGPLGNACRLGLKPFTALGQSVCILGWYRQSYHAWLDVDRICLPNGRLIKAAYPLFSFLIASATTLLGLWLLIQSSGYAE